eukprot:GHVN01068410.1.p1 GENE.GHVN01068410.1~~GHVN01068410.1.p1  ORF type:complete len:141 (-),score=25.08 GHVN01068410.1:2139-2561(-)
MAPQYQTTKDSIHYPPTEKPSRLTDLSSAPNGGISSFSQGRLGSKPTKTAAGRVVDERRLSIGNGVSPLFAEFRINGSSTTPRGISPEQVAQRRKRRILSEEEVAQMRVKMDEQAKLAEQSLLMRRMFFVKGSSNCFSRN